MKIGFFTDTYLPTIHGIETSIETFRQELERLGHQVYIYAPYSPGYVDKHPDRVFRLESMKIIRKPEIRFAFPFIHHGRMKDILNFRLDIIHVQTPFSLGFLGKFISLYQEIPLVYTHHTDYPEYAKVYFKDRIVLPVAARAWTTRFSNMSDMVIAPSYKIKDQLKDWGVKKPITILPTGVPTDSFNRTPESERAALALRKKFGVQRFDKVLLFVGRLGQEKNIPFLLKMCREISKKRSDIKFLLVGEGPYGKTYESLARKMKLENAIFTGKIQPKKMPMMYQSAQLFVFSSVSETQGLVILEAFASGLPCIALQDDAFKNVILNNQNGFLIDQHHPQLFGQKVLRILDDEKLYKKFSEGALKTADRYSEKNQTTELLAIYQKLRESK